MKNLLPLVLGITLFISCNKKEEEKQPEYKVHDFFVSFKVLDSTYNYKVGTNYAYESGTATNAAIGSQSSSFRAITSIIPIPLDANNKKIYFAFTGGAFLCLSCDKEAEAREIGNLLFANNKEYKVGYTGLNYNTLTHDIWYTGGVAIAMQFDQCKYLASTPAVQPQSTFFIIDSVINESYTNLTYGSNSYEKIIIGRFNCRLFCPENTTIYKDLVEGKFRMPIWRKTMYQ
jgi:hypothetical protein